MKKRILSTVLSLALLVSILSLTSIPAFAAETTVSTYDALVSAVNAASDGDVITITSTITVATGNTIGSLDKTVTLKADSGLVGSMIQIPYSAVVDTTTLQNLIIDGNNAVAPNYSIIVEDTVNIQNVVFQNFTGGAMSITSGNNSVINNCEFLDCAGTMAAFIYVDSSVSLRVINSSFTNGSASENDSGAILCNGNLVLENSEVIGNSCNGIRAQSNSSVTIEASTITGNNTYRRGCGLTATNCSVELNNAKIYGNVSDNSASDIFFSEVALTYSADSTLYNSTEIIPIGYFSDEQQNRYSASNLTDPFVIASGENINCSLVMAYEPRLRADIAIESKSIQKSNTMDIAVSIDENDGLSCYVFVPTFNTDIFTLTGITGNQEAGTFLYNDDANNPKLIWYNSEDYSGSGNIFTMSFSVSDTAPDGDYSIGLSYEQNNVCNSEGKPVELTISEGDIHIFSFILGDANGDLNVTAADVVYLARYIIGLETTIDSNAADVNKDGSVDGRDVVFLARVMVGLNTLEG